MRSSFHLSIRDLSEEDMLRIMSNENVETEEDRTQYQIDTCVAVGQFLIDNPEIAKKHYVNYMRTHPEIAKTQHFNIDAKVNTNVVFTWKPQAHWKPNNEYSISDFLGTRNWSKSTVINLLKIHRDLAPEITRELMNFSSGNDKKEER